MADLQGKRVVVGPAGAGFEHFVAPILEAHGLSYDDIRPLHDTQAGAVALLADGSADAAFLGGGRAHRIHYPGLCCPGNSLCTL